MEHSLKVYLKSKNDDFHNMKYCLLNLKGNEAKYILDCEMLPATENEDNSEFPYKNINISDVVSIIHMYKDTQEFLVKENIECKKELEQLTEELLKTKTTKTYSEKEKIVNNKKAQIEDNNTMIQILVDEEVMWSYGVLMIFVNTLEENNQWDNKNGCPKDIVDFELWYYLN